MSVRKLTRFCVSLFETIFEPNYDDLKEKKRAQQVPATKHPLLVVQMKMATILKIWNFLCVQHRISLLRSIIALILNSTILYSAMSLIEV